MIMATVVLGLVGGNWSLLEPWLEQDRLPNIDHLREEGAWGISISVNPPVTCPNWKCYVSSRAPDHHDVYWWEKVDRRSLDIDVPDSTSFTAPELGDYLNDEGLRTGVINLPMSYPPRELDGVMVAGGPRSREQNYTYPEALEEQIESDHGYRVHPENVVTSNDDEAGVEATLDLIETRFETARALLEVADLDFLHLTIFHLNVLQHYFYDGEPTRRAWELIDYEIGRFLDEGHNIFLMSDHGCAEIETVFHVNEWLQANDFLETETSAADYLMTLGITQERLAGVVRAVGLESRIRRYVPRRLVERFPDEEGIKRDSKFDKVVQDESDAIASGQGLIYVFHEPASERYERTVDRLVGELEALETPHGTPVASAVHRGDELYPNGDPRYRPDVVFEQGPGLHTSGAIGKSTVFDDPGRWRAENVRDGMFLAHGPDIDSIGKLDPISILDIAPTILHSMGLSIPKDFEGEPVTEITDDQEAVSYREPLPGRGDDARTDDDAVQERLADLGYLE
jgi:predicted AlkP superfamily phosphohydrolase/phosphomutase